MRAAAMGVCTTLWSGCQCSLLATMVGTMVTMFAASVCHGNSTMASRTWYVQQCTGFTTSQRMHCV